MNSQTKVDLYFISTMDHTNSALLFQCWAQASVKSLKTVGLNSQEQDKTLSVHVKIKIKTKTHKCALLAGD